VSGEDTIKRSATMRAVKSRDTTPELIVRALLRRFAPSYRLHRKDLPGNPDIAYIGKRRAIFVHGCFGTAMIARAARERQKPTPNIGAPRSPETAPATKPTPKSSASWAGAR